MGKQLDYMEKQMKKLEKVIKINDESIIDKRSKDELKSILNEINVIKDKLEDYLPKKEAELGDNP